MSWTSKARKQRLSRPMPGPGPLSPRPAVAEARLGQDAWCVGLGPLTVLGDGGGRVEAPAGASEPCRTLTEINKHRVGGRESRAPQAARSPRGRTGAPGQPPQPTPSHTSSLRVCTWSDEKPTDGTQRVRGGWGRRRGQELTSWAGQGARVHNAVSMTLCRNTLTRLSREEKSDAPQSKAPTSREMSRSRETTPGVLSPTRGSG